MFLSFGQDGLISLGSTAFILLVSELGVVMNIECSEQEANTLWIHVREGKTP
jgi:hypothetical protein